tara:strand:- start:578 stop:1114 length:537 start_codon:yes stop_codon:yes gene_type:complete
MTTPPNEAWLHKWIENQTKDFACTVNFGSGLGVQDRFIKSPVKLSVELHAPTLKAAVLQPGGVRLGADMRRHRSVIRPSLDFVALFVDSLEHVNKDDACKLIRELQEDGYGGIAVMAPQGVHVQEEDVTGHNNPYQKHLSTWYAYELEELEFDVFIYEGFHSWHPSPNCLFGVWRPVR